VDNVVGGQLVYPLVDDAWRPVPSPELDDALREVPGLYVSIRLGGQVVLGGTAEALAEAQRRLPPRRAGERDAPFLLPLHSAFHTPLMAATAARARDALHDLDWRAPAVPMVDGRGAVLRPRHADPDDVRSWTLGAQVTEPYDFTAALRVALREYAPDAIILLGPGGNLGGAIGQTLAAEGWAGVRGRADFARIQGAAPLLLSMARDDQRRRALGT
jgi:malonyl CoA-acyl carrier protein transacylase